MANLRCLAWAICLLAILAGCKLSLDGAACPCTTGWVCCADQNVCIREGAGQCSGGSGGSGSDDAGTEVAPIQRLDLDEAVPGDRLGAGVALAGDVAAIGMPGRGTAAPSGGAVAVFERRGIGRGVWVRLPELTAPDPADHAGFGSTVAFAGGALLVGAPGLESGRVYLYRRAADGWSWSQTIEPDVTGIPDGKLASLGFGSAMAADQDRVIIAAAGALAHVYQITSDGAVHLARIDPPGGPANDDPLFASDVAIHGSEVAVASFATSASTVAVYVFDEAQGWARTTLATDFSEQPALGIQIAFDGQRLAVADGPTVSMRARRRHLGRGPGREARSDRAGADRSGVARR